MKEKLNAIENLAIAAAALSELGPAADPRIHAIAQEILFLLGDILPRHAAVRVHDVAFAMERRP